jgi:large subunit ribosomal protein L15
MVVNKRTKFSRYRASHTHGGGHKKKRRGAGNRGGRGRAGSGKRGDAKKPSYWKEEKAGKGFVSMKKTHKTINIADLKKLSGETLNLKELGYDKLLGTGKPDKKYLIIVDYASKKTIEKINQVGGEVSGLKEKKVKTKKEVKQKKVQEETESEEVKEVKSEPSQSTEN